MDYLVTPVVQSICGHHARRFEMCWRIISKQSSSFLALYRWMFSRRSGRPALFPMLHNMCERKLAVIVKCLHHKILGIEINESIQQNLWTMSS